jgi:hypothetical protein
MTREDPPEERVEDLDAPEAETEEVKGGALNAYISPVKGEKQGGDPDQPVVAAKLPGLHKSTDVTLKRG